MISSDSSSGRRSSETSCSPGPTKRRRLNSSSRSSSPPSLSSKSYIPPRNRLAGVRVPSLVKSLSSVLIDNGYDEPKLPSAAPESTALRQLLPQDVNRFVTSREKVRNQDDDDDSIYIELDDFIIYRPSDRGRHPSELVSLNQLGVGNDVDTFCFDGRLRYGEQSCKVTEVRFRIMSIDGYGRDEPFHPAVIYIQSVQNTASRTWYRLRSPSPAYGVYHQPFLWLAEFSIYFVAYLEHRMENGQETQLLHFRHDFNTWLLETAVRHPGFQQWLAVHGGHDFRQVLAAYFDFLWKQATDVMPAIRNQFFWKEVDGTDLRAVKQQPIREESTIVTPFAFECFRGSYFRDSLKQIQMAPEIYKAWTARARRMGLSCLTRDDLDVQNVSQQHQRSAEITNVSTGDVIIIESEVDGVWSADERGWYAYVQDICEDRYGPWLSLIWLYKPDETICKPGYFPFSNELFMSDHCNCGDERVRLAHITRKVDVKFFAKEVEKSDGLYVRQAFITPDEEGGKDAAFVSLNVGHFRCQHRKKQQLNALERSRSSYPAGSTVLVDLDLHLLLEPVIVTAYTSRAIQVRRLRRRRDLDDAAKPNELLDTTEVFLISPSSVARACLVRRFEAAEVRRGDVPAPYSYGGTADAWCLTGLLSESLDILPIDLRYPPSFAEGFDPCTSELGEKLSGLSLFSGGGSFDRGLEEGQALHTKFAVEFAKAPIHTYRANLDAPDDTNLYFGSVNDFLKEAMQGSTAEVVAKLNQVLFICAGSPCKGFSVATQDKLSQKAKGYASLVASVIAYINFYCPAYAVLENVVDMCSSVKGEKSENVFSQIVAALVSMGYQISIANYGSWMMGSCQQRSRLFILVAAPGLEPLIPPPQSHSHPPKARTRHIGRTDCGLSYGLSTPSDIKCPFTYVSAEDGTSGLPNIGTGKVRTCISHPDHRLAVNTGSQYGMTIAAVPRFPSRQSFATARSEERLSTALLDVYSERPKEWHATTSKAFQRINKDGLMPTVKTSQRPDCARMGNCVHWDQSRSLTIMEARRAQSIPDHEVLVGYPREQFMVVGNGVDRKVSVAIGMSLRRSWRSPLTQAFLGRTERHQGIVSSVGHLAIAEDRTTSMVPEEMPPVEEKARPETAYLDEDVSKHQLSAEQEVLAYQEVAAAQALPKAQGLPVTKELLATRGETAKHDVPTTRKVYTVRDVATFTRRVPAIRYVAASQEVSTMHEKLALQRTSSRQDAASMRTFPAISDVSRGPEPLERPEVSHLPDVIVIDSDDDESVKDVVFIE